MSDMLGQTDRRRQSTGGPAESARMPPRDAGTTASAAPPSRSDQDAAAPDPGGARPGLCPELFAMVSNDDSRKRSAWALLGRIESWRLEYGDRPARRGTQRLTLVRLGHRGSRRDAPGVWSPACTCFETTTRGFERGSPTGLQPRCRGTEHRGAKFVSAQKFSRLVWTPAMGTLEPERASRREGVTPAWCG